MAQFKTGDRVIRTGARHTQFLDKSKVVITLGEYTVNVVKTSSTISLVGYGTYGYTSSMFDLVTVTNDTVTYDPYIKIDDVVYHSLSDRHGIVKEVENHDHDTLLIKWDDSDVSSEIPRAELTKSTPTQPKGQSMNSTIAKLFAKSPTEEAVLVDKHLSPQIAQNDVSVILLEGKQKELLAFAKAKEAKQQAAINK